MGRTVLTGWTTAPGLRCEYSTNAESIASTMSRMLTRSNTVDEEMKSGASIARCPAILNFAVSLTLFRELLVDVGGAGVRSLVCAARMSP